MLEIDCTCKLSNLRFRGVHVKSLNDRDQRTAFVLTHVDTLAAPEAYICTQRSLKLARASAVSTIHLN